jgi:hypothetical protein
VLHTFAMINLGLTSICFRTLTNASATFVPMARDDSSSSPVMSFRLVIRRTSFPALRLFSASAAICFRVLLLVLRVDAIRSWTSTSNTVSFPNETRWSVKSFSWAVVFGTCEPAMMRPPVSLGQGNFSWAALMGGIERIPSRLDKKVAPVRYM